MRRIIEVDTERQVTSFDRHAEPVAHVAPGEIVTVRTLDWCYGRVTAHPSTYRRATERPRCPCAGPIFVKGAAPGDTLAVDILDIAVQSPGKMALRPEVGPLGGHLAEMRVVEVPIADGIARLPGGYEAPVKPMLGVIGVAPEGDPAPTLDGGPHGGNLDTREIGAGATVLLPVSVPGALLGVGDAHAAMGDGELSGSGIEAAAEITLRAHAIPGGISAPRVITPDWLIALATAPALEDALKGACDNMMDWLCRGKNLPAEHAALLLGVYAECRISQCVNAAGPTVKVMLPLAMGFGNLPSISQLPHFTRQGMISPANDRLPTMKGTERCR